MKDVYRFVRVIGRG